MGIDLLDITFRVERRLGLTLDLQELRVHFESRKPRDVSVGELVGALRDLRRCRKCKYDLRGHGPTGICPECGGPFGPLAESVIFEAVRDAVAGALGVRPEKVTPDALLVRDLGMS